MRRAMTIVSCVLVSLALTANIALADTCVNVSRSAPAPGTDTIRGNWVWFEGFGWFMAVPGGPASTGAYGPTFPGANGNYTDGDYVTLLGPSANCDTLKETSRQTTNGIQVHPFACP